MNEVIRRVQADFDRDFTEAGLRVAIIAVAILLIILALTIRNKWVLAGILAYEILP